MNAAPSVGSGFYLKSWVTNRKRIEDLPTPIIYIKKACVVNKPASPSNTTFTSFTFSIFYT